MTISKIYLGSQTGNKTVIVGGARGIGRGIAQAFVDAGSQVHLVDANPVVLETAEELGGNASGVSAEVADATSDSDMKKVFSSLAERWGSLNTVVNNAGIIVIDDLATSSTADFEKVLAVNTTTQFIVAREALPLLKASGGGVILNAASGQARQGFIYTPSYAASKFGVIGLTQSLAKELARENIRVNAYCPGIVGSDMWDYNDREWGRRLGDYAPGELMAEWVADIPMGRAGTNADVANLLLFLASDAANYITGQAVNVDGGMFMN